MSRVPTVRQADLDRALRALKAAGLGVARIEVRPGGSVVIVPGGPIEDAEAPDLTDPTTPAKPDSLEDWRRQKVARRAAQGT